MKGESMYFRIIVVLLALATAAMGNEQAVEFFESKIRPVLVEHCYSCHNSNDTAEGGLALDYRKAMLAGGDNGKIIVPGKPTESRLLPILRHEEAIRQRQRLCDWH